jgi:hypothetical protein
MAKRPKKSISSRLDDLDIAITNVRDDKILALLTKKGYDVPKLDEGRFWTAPLA